MRVWRTVREDGSVLIEGTVWYGDSAHARAVMQGWAGRRVHIQDENFWGTVLSAALHHPCRDAVCLKSVRVKSEPSEGTTP